MAGQRRGLVARVEPGTHILPLSRGAPGSMGRTGTWRTERPIVHSERCVSCYLCWLYCPEHAIDMAVGKGPKGRDIPVINYEYCKGCLICANVCPVKAIDVVPEEKYIRKELEKLMRR